MEKGSRYRSVVYLWRESSNARSRFHPTELAVRYLERCCLSKRPQREPDRKRFHQRKRDCRFSRVASLQRKIPGECFGFVEIAAAAAHFWKSKRAGRLARRRVGRRRRREQADNRQIKTGFGQRSLRQRALVTGNRRCNLFGGRPRRADNFPAQRQNGFSSNRSDQRGDAGDQQDRARSRPGEVCRRLHLDSVRLEKSRDRQGGASGEWKSDRGISV